MTTTSTEYRMKWLQALACTRAMPRSVLAVAMILITKYLNGATGEAWPSLRTLGADLHVQRGHVTAAIDQLEAAGFLRVVAGGPRRSNHYKIRIPRQHRAAESAEVMSPSRGTKQPPQGAITQPSYGSLRGSSAAPCRDPQRLPQGSQNPLNEPLTEPNAPQRQRQEKDVVVQENKSGSSQPKSSVPAHRNRARLFPVDWDCGRREFAAAADITGWDAERAVAEFEKFRSWHSGRGIRSPDWFEYWENWCRKGTEIDARERSRGKPRTDRAKAGVLGVAKWYQEQQATAYDELATEEEGNK